MTVDNGKVGGREEKSFEFQLIISNLNIRYLIVKVKLTTSKAAKITPW